MVRLEREYVLGLALLALGGFLVVSSVPYVKVEPLISGSYTVEPCSYLALKTGIPRSLAEMYMYQDMVFWESLTVVDYFETASFHRNTPYVEAEAYMDTLTGMFKLVVDAGYAETYTYRVEVGKPHIRNVYWEDTGTTHTEITGKATAVVEVENTGAAGGEFVVRAYIQPEDTPAYVSPESHQIALDPGETATLTFDVINKGTDKDVEGTLVIEMIETATAEKDTVSLTFTLKATYGLPYTYLYVYTYDKMTEERVPGIEVTVTYGEDSKTATTDETGVAFFDLGNYTGPITIQTAETDEYMASTLKTTVTSGENHKIVELIPKEEATEVMAKAMTETLRTNLLWMALGALIVVVAVLGVTVIVMWRRR